MIQETRKRGVDMRSIRGLILLAVTAFAGCSDSAGPGDRMTRAESLALVAAIVQSADASYADGMAEASAIGGDGLNRLELVRDLDIVAPCPLGGSAELGLTLAVLFDGEEESATIDLDGTLTHIDCGFINEGVTLTVSGDPHLSFAAHASSVRGVANPFTVEVAGALDWGADDGRAGRCVVSIDAVTDFTAGSRVVTADVCGQRISQTLSWS